MPQRQDADEQQEGGQEDRNQGEQSAAPAARRPGHDRAQVGGKGEQRPRHRLCHTVTGDELVAGDPSRRDHLRLQQRQHHVAAAEHQRSGAVEPVEHAQPLAVHNAAGDRQPGQQQAEGRQPHHRAQRAAGGGSRGCAGRRSGRILEQQHAGRCRRGDRQHLGQRGAPEQHADGRDNGYRRARPVGCQVACHAIHGERDHRHRHHLESAQPAARRELAERGHAVPEQDQQRGRWQGETEPRRDAAADAGAGHAHRHADLAAGRTGQELAQRDQIRVGFVVEPPAFGYVFIAEVPQVSHRPAERGKPQLEGHEQNFKQACDHFPAAATAAGRLPPGPDGSRSAAIAQSVHGQVGVGGAGRLRRRASAMVSGYDAYSIYR